MSYCETIWLAVCLNIRLCQTGWLGVVSSTSTEVHKAYIDIILLFNRPDHSKHYVSPGGQNSSHKQDWGAVGSIQALVGVRDKWPKSKYQNFKSTQWFSYKIWIKNSEEPIVYLHNWPLPEQHHFLKIQSEINFLTFWMLTESLQKKIRTEI